MLRLCFLLAVARALQAPPRQRRATQLQAAEAVEVAADAFDQFGVAAVAASAKLASQDPAGEKPSDAQTRGVVGAPRWSRCLATPHRSGAEDRLKAWPRSVLPLQTPCSDYDYVA